MLIESLSPGQWEHLRAIYGQASVSDADVAIVTGMLDQHDVAARVQALTETYHESALSLLETLGAPSPHRQALGALAGRLVERAR